MTTTGSQSLFLADGLDEIALIEDVLKGGVRVEDYEKGLIISEVSVSLLKSLISNIPLVGTVVNEAFFECRGRIKQERVNRFIEQLSSFMETLNSSEINFNYIKSENFGDVFESILKRVMLSGSDEKMQRFKQILVNQMVEPYISDYTETFLDIISRINDTQIYILNIHRKIKNCSLDLDESIMERGTLDANFETKISVYRTPQFYSLDPKIYQFYVQDLISKALLYDEGINRFDCNSFEVLDITEFGIEFLKFIERKEF